MKYLVSFFILFILLLPHNVFAACSTDRLTVVYINGILTSKIDAEKDRDNLKKKYEDRTGTRDISFIVGHNQSHIAGLGDLAESASQLFNSSISNYDRNTILLQLYPEITTRKILLVGHSQGTFYTNELYDYLLAHGESKESVGVYNLATPASYVSSGGAYLTSQNDKVVNAVRDVAEKIKARQPLPANVTIPLTAKEAADKFGGHSFSGVYLANESGRIVSEINDGLKKLVATEAPIMDAEGCFTPPPKNISYYAQEAVFAVADPAAAGAVAVAGGVKTAGQIAYKGALVTINSAVNLAETAYANIEKLFVEIPFTKGLALISNSFGGSAQLAPSEVEGLVADDSEQQSNIPAATNNNPENQNAANDNQPENDSTNIAVNGNNFQIAPTTAVNGETEINTSPDTNKSEDTDLQTDNSNSSSAITAIAGPPIGGSGPVPSPPQNNSSVNTLASETESTSSSTDNSSPSNSSSSDSSASSENPTSTAPTQTFPTINSFQASYNFAPRVDFSWLPSVNASGSSSNITYHIYDITDPSSTVTIFQTASSSASYSFNNTIDEVGRDYKFKFVVEAADGSTGLTTGGSSNSTTTTISANSFLDNFYFYKKPGATSTAYLFDITTTSSRPFWDTTKTSNDINWKAIVFYINKDAPEEAEISTTNQLVPSDGSHVRVSYDGCAGGAGDHELIFPKNSSSCVPGALSAHAYNFTKLEDARLTIQLSSSTSDITFSSNDYITLAFYDFGGGGGGSQRLRLAAVDKTKYYFTPSAPDQNSPTVPQNFSANFNTLTEKTDLVWSSSTDSDTLDTLITYEINYATSSVLDAANWQSNGNLLSTSITPVFPNTYKIGVRSTDNMDNVSTSTEVDWSFPVGYVPLPSQLNHDSLIGFIGGNQKFLITATTTIDAVALWAEPDGGVYNNSQSYIQIRKDNNDHANGQTVGSSTAKTMGQFNGAQELIYTFDTPFQLEASSSYWIVTLTGPSETTNGTRFYGNTSNPYADGYWSANDSRDAYFRLIKQ